MTVKFYSLQENGANYEEVATVENGEIVDGEDALPPLHEDELNDEERLLEHYNGPYLVAGEPEEPVERSFLITEPRSGVVGKYNTNGTFNYNGSHKTVTKFLSMGDPSGLEATPASLVADSDRGTDLLKQAQDTWVPYQGPQGGEGWQQVGSGEVRYQQNAPGPVADGYDENHWQQRWPELKNTEWNTDLPDAIDMKDGDTVLFVNRDGMSEVAEVVNATFVRREGWDSAKTGVKLRDGREVTVDEIAAYAPTASAVEPPELHEDPGWEDAPGVWTKYNSGELVHFTNDDGDTRIGRVVGSSGNNGVKVQTTERFQVVDPNRIAHRAQVDDNYNVGYAMLDSPFEDVPDLEFSLDAPEPEFASKFGATVEDVRDAFGTVFGGHLMDNLEAELDGTRYDDNPREEAPDYDRDDPGDWIRAIRNYRGTDSAGAYADFKWELRGRANGLGSNRVERIIDEAFALDVSDPSYNIRQKLEGEERNDPEKWLQAAADYAIEADDWVSIGKLQDAIDDWSGTVPFGVNNLHGNDGEPDEVIPLSETGTNAGISAGAMFIAEWSNGNRAFITRIRDRQEHGNFHSMFMESSDEAERAMTGYEVQSTLNEGNESVRYPDHEYRFDTYYSVEGAPDDAVLANHYLEEKPTAGIELPDGKPENEIVESIGADVEDVRSAIVETLQPEALQFIGEQIDNDPNMDVENPADWVAGAKNRYQSDNADTWNSFVEAMAEEAYTSPVDHDDFMDMAAASIIAGNKDLHSSNVMADDEGNIYPIDLDFAGYDMTDDRDRKGAIGKLVATASSLGVEASEDFAGQGDPNDYDKAERPIGQEILARVEAFANEVDPDTVRSANPMYHAKGMGDNVQANYEAAKRGELQ